MNKAGHPNLVTLDEARRIKKLADRATPGPWGGAHLGLETTGGYLGYTGYGRQVQLWRQDRGGHPFVYDGVAVCERGLHGMDEANATFIAAARTDVPRLAETVLALWPYVESWALASCLHTGWIREDCPSCQARKLIKEAGNE